MMNLIFGSGKLSYTVVSVVYCLRFCESVIGFEVIYFLKLSLCFMLEDLLSNSLVMTAPFSMSIESFIPVLYD